MCVNKSYNGCVLMTYVDLFVSVVDHVKNGSALPVSDWELHPTFEGWMQLVFVDLSVVMVTRSIHVCSCRDLHCNHLQCFDASSYLAMNSNRETWKCPVCDQSTSFTTLAVDQ